MNTLRTKSELKVHLGQAMLLSTHALTQTNTGEGVMNFLNRQLRATIGEIKELQQQEIYSRSIDPKIEDYPDQLEILDP